MTQTSGNLPAAGVLFSNPTPTVAAVRATGRPAPVPFRPATVDSQRTPPPVLPGKRRRAGRR